MSSPEDTQPSQPGAHLEPRIRSVGQELAASLSGILDALPGGVEAGPQKLAEALGVDRVLTHRILKATRVDDPLACAYHAPGPEPMRRFLRRARQRGVDNSLVQRASAAISQFESLVRDELGNRSALTSVLASFLPEARHEFELRRKQSAYRAMSELFGNDCDVSVHSVYIAPSADGISIDIAWVMGTLGLRRLRPGVTVKFATKRHAADGSATQLPQTLDGRQGAPDTDYRIDQFHVAAPAPVEILESGDALHYVLGETGFGPTSVTDLLMGELTRAGIPKTVPAHSGRRGWFYGSSTIPARTLLFEVHVHRDIYPDSEPELLLYNSHENGVADVNDISRDIDRMDLIEELEFLGCSSKNQKTRVAPRHHEVTAHVFEQLGWNPGEFNCWRTTIDYPVYGMQVVMAFDPPETPGSADEEESEDSMRRIWQ